LVEFTFSKNHLGEIAVKALVSKKGVRNAKARIEKLLDDLQIGWLCACYGHLLPVGIHSPTYFIEQISSTYSPENPVNGVAVSTLATLADLDNIENLPLE